ncbi:BTAD domain-containing putative transcriptional regulator, partial [Spirillospora sp. NPDC049652]
MEIRMLGPLEVTADDGARVEPSQPLQRAALCVLAVRAGRPVSARALGELLWGDDAPGRGAGAVKTCLSGVRRALTRDRLPLGHGGYRIVPRPGDVFDLADFRDLSARAREALARAAASAADAAGEAERSREEAAELFGRALALWREPVLADLPRTPSLVGVRAGLLGERRRVREEAAETLLALGRHRELIPDLRAWLEDDPLNESLAGALVLALHRSGRKAEALRSYERTRAAITAATGTEPGQALRGLAERVRRDEAVRPGGAGRAAATGRTAAGTVRELPPLRQLPPDVRDFTGRDAERDELEALLRTTSAVPPIVHVTGPPGIGKTALALHVAHRVEDAYPDGQIHVQLAGASMVPREVSAVLGEVLRALGVRPGDIPDTVEARAAAYRSRLAGRRVLVFADDAADAA